MTTPYLTLIAAAVQQAEIADWSYGRGDRHDAIRLPHPSDCGAEQGDGDGPPSWGDYPSEVIAEIERQVVAKLAPGRRVADGGEDEAGSYLILAVVA